MDYFRRSPTPHDMCIACGVLYHMSSPVELISSVAKNAKQVFFWTHYYDEKICQNNLYLRFLFNTHTKSKYEGFAHTLHRYHYRASRSLLKFCGGPVHFSNWLSRDDILNACAHFGLKNIQIKFEEPNHPHGPCFAFTAQRE